MCISTTVSICIHTAWSMVRPGEESAYHSLYLCCRCTLIDLRPQKISKSQRKWLKSFASSQPNDIATMQHSDTSTPIASTDIPPTSPDLPAQAGLPQHVTRKLQHSTAAAPGSTDGALSAVTPPAELSCSATHHQDSAQAQVSAAEEPALPGSAATQGSAIEAEVLADAAQAQASVSQTRAPCEGQQSCMAHSQQPASHDEGCKLQQSVSTQASAQQNWPDLRGTLSNQVRVGHQLIIVNTATAHCCWQRLLITPSY